MKLIIVIDALLIAILIADCVAGYISVGEIVIVLMLMRIWYAIRSGK